MSTHTERAPRWMSALSYTLVALSLLLTTAILSVRMGQEQRLQRTAEGAHLLSSREWVRALEEGSDARRYADPLLSFELAPDGGALMANTSLCFPPPVDQTSAETEAAVAALLAGFEAVWVEVDGLGKRSVQRRLPLVDHARPLQSREGLVCLRLPDQTIPSLEHGGGYGLFLTASLSGPQRAWLSRAPMTSIMVITPRLGPVEALAWLLMVAAILLRLLVWQRTPPRDDPARTPWRLFDLFFCGVILVMFLMLSFAFTGREPDAPLQILVSLLVPIAAYVAVPRVVTGRRTQTPRSALGLVRPLRAWTWPALAVGLTLGAAAAALLAALPPPPSSSHIQEIARMQGAVAALLVVSTIGAWFQEVFLRGFVFGLMEARYNAAAATLASVLFHALIAAPLHVGFLWPLLPLLLMSLLASLLRWQTRSTTPALALHLGYVTTLAIAILTNLLPAARL